MQTFTAAPYDDVLILMIQIGILLLTARAFSEIAQRLGQPAVIGEILAGVFWGPSLISNFFPQFQSIVLPQNTMQGHLLEEAGMFGAMFLLLLTGIETDLPLIRRQARSSLGAAFGGIILPFVSGFILSEYFIPDYLLVNPSQRFIFTLFMATAMSISAIPVISRVLIELGLLRRDLGQSIIAAGMLDDAVGWILLSLVTGMATGQNTTWLSAISPLIQIIMFSFLSFTLGKFLISKIYDFVQDRMNSRDRILTLVIGLAFLWGALTKAMHFEPVLGAFVLGIIMGEIPRFNYEVKEKLETIAISIFSPIFFAIAGLKVNLAILFKQEYFHITLIVFLLACFGKIVGAYLGARIIGHKDHWTSLGFGAALNARGAMEIIVATIGLSSGILSQEMFSIIVVMALSTSLMAPAMLKWILKHIQLCGEELSRLKKEKLINQSQIARINRILLPIREASEEDLTALQVLKLKLIEAIANKKKISLTTINVSSSNQKLNDKKSISQVLSKYWNGELIFKTIKSSDVSSVILDEQDRGGYDLIVLGSSNKLKDSNPLSSIIGDLLRMATCPTLVAYSNSESRDFKFQKILVTVTSSIASKHAAELAFSIAGEQDTVTLLSIITGDSARWFQSFYQHSIDKQADNYQNAINEIKELVSIYKNVQINEIIEFGYDVSSTVLKIAAKEDIDLIILGTSFKSGFDKLFLGPKIEHILQHSHCPVLLLNS